MDDDEAIALAKDVAGSAASDAAIEARRRATTFREWNKINDETYKDVYEEIYAKAYPLIFSALYEDDEEALQTCRRLYPEVFEI